MARSKTLPARKPERSDESLLLRSAESLGRMIGTLQRQLDEATRHLSQLGSTPPEPEAPPAAHRSKLKPKSVGARNVGAASARKRGRATSTSTARASAGGNGNAAKPRARKTAAKKKTRSR
jgi:hypothetical protein